MLTSADVCWRMRVPGWQFTELFSPSGAKFRRCLKTLDETLYALVDARIARREHENDNSEQDLLGIFAQARDLKGQPFDRTMLRDMLITRACASHGQRSRSQ